MEMDDSIPQPTVGMQFGIVQKMSSSFRSNVRYGVLCEVTEFEYESQSTSMEIQPKDGNQQSKGFVMVKAIGRQRFHISRILHRALDGLIITCETTIFQEVNSDVDKTLSKSAKFTALKN